MKNRKIAVYGTLMEGYGNHRLLATSKKIGVGITKEKYELTASGIPFVNSKKKTHRVNVEVYEVPLDQMDSIDSLEGHPNWYFREPIEVILENGEIQIAEIYFNNNSQGEIIKSGNYRDYK